MLHFHFGRRFSVFGFVALSLVGCGDGDEPSEKPINVGGSGGAVADLCVIDVDTTSYDYDLDLPWSQNPPGGLAPADVPQFVVLGWDDNGFLEPFNWARNMLRVRGLKSSFMQTTTYISDGSIAGNPGFLRGSWEAAYREGHEIGNHTQYHLDGQPVDGEPFTPENWRGEIETAFQWLTAPYESDEADVDLGIGIPREEIFGFRSPFLHYNDSLFEELRQTGIWYDCSIEEGWQLDIDASQFPWPYTLDNGSPGHEYARERDFEAKGFPLSEHRGIIELPAYALVIPPDDVADDYDFDEGLFDRVREAIPEREPGSDRMTGLDFNIWWDAQLSKEEAVAVLKYNLDQRLSGNRSPFLFGVHTDFYRENWGIEEPDRTLETYERRREAIEEFLDYATGLEGVRVTTFKEVVDFLREPRPLDCY